MSNVVRDGEMPNGSPLPIGEGVAMNQCSRCGGELGTADTDGLCAVCRYKPSAQAAGSVRGCHNCEHGHLGGWKTLFAHWPCLTCRVGSGLCCGDDNWKPNAPVSGGTPSAQVAGSVSESDRALAMIRDATDHALDESGLVESVAVLISQRNNARRYAETFRAKLKELGHEFV